MSEMQPLSPQDIQDFIHPSELYPPIFDPHGKEIERTPIDGYASMAESFIASSTILAPIQKPKR